MQTEIETLFDQKPSTYTEEHFALFARFKQALNDGAVRSAEPDASASSGWRVNIWVKKGVLLGFRMGAVVDMSPDPVRLPMFDKATFPVKRLGPDSGVRLVPGGSSIRDGCFIGRGVVCMPPMYVNAGTYIGEGTMIDSHALVGSCAQIGKNCHISAAAQIGGVLEPVGSLPVIIEDEVLVGGNCGVYEGTVVKRRAVLGSGVDPDALDPRIRRRARRSVQGHRRGASGDSRRRRSSGGLESHRTRTGKDWGISLYTPVIVKYRDSKTDARVQLEDLLRS